MDLANAWVPYGGYWTTPFSKWQMSFATLPPIPFAAETAKDALASRDVPTEAFDGMCLGMTVPSRHSFYGAPWLAGLMGMEDVTGPNISQACATSVRCLVYGA
ncbi:MAG: thiolase family protein, partial [Planctomycetota bacterium]